MPVSGDTWIQSDEPTINHGTDTLLSLRTAADDDDGGDRRILIKFDLASLSDSPVIKATLYFYINSTNGATIFLYRPTIDWVGTQTTWELAQTDRGWTNEGGDYDVNAPIISTDTMADCRVQLDVTALVQDWSTGGINNGVILIASGSLGEISIPSSRATPAANRPILLVVTNTPTVTATVTGTATSTATGTVTLTSTGTVTPTVTLTP